MTVIRFLGGSTNSIQVGRRQLGEVCRGPEIQLYDRRFTDLAVLPFELSSTMGAIFQVTSHATGHCPRQIASVIRCEVCDRFLAREIAIGIWD